jgi:oligopeptide transport system permease protein
VTAPPAVAVRSGATSERGPVRPQRTFWRDAWDRLRENKLAVVSFWYVVALAAVALAAPVLAPFSFDAQDILISDQGPTSAHPFGTDALGRDILSRLLYGSRISLAVALVDIAIVLVVGVSLGLVAGYFGRWLDTVIMRTVDVLFAFPSLLLVIVVITFLRAILESPGGGVLEIVRGLDALTGGLLGVFIALGLVSWLTVARLVRAEALSLKERDFVVAARMVGASDGRIMFRHLLPNTMAPIIVAATIGIPGAIATEAGLSFLGLGVRPPFPSWGILIAEGVRAMRAFPHEIVFPAGLLAVTLICFTFLGDGLRDALDPRLTRRVGERHL